MASNHVLTLIQEQFPTYHPLVALAELAHEEGLEPRVRFQCHATIAKYIEPELKSIEIKAPPGSELGLLRVVVQKERTFDMEGNIIPNSTTLPEPKIIEMTGEVVGVQEAIEALL